MRGIKDGRHGWEMKLSLVLILSSLAYMLMGHMNKIVVILAGGRGSRMGEHTDLVPKPMVEIGGIPIISHIMHLFTKSLGRCHFIVAGGYRWQYIQQFFSKNEKVTVLDTGMETQTGGRILETHRQINLTQPFYLSYGDGLTSFDLSRLEFRQDEIVNMLVTHPIGRFGEVKFLPSGEITEFSEKPIHDRWINGGFFRVHSSILDYIETPQDVLETDVFSRLLEDKKLFCTPHDGFWHCMDTPKDWKELNEEYKKGTAKWLK